MQRVLCYGDLNSWVYYPVTQDRFNKYERWTGQLTLTPEGGYDVIEESLNGRTTVLDDPFQGYKNGRDYPIPCLETHKLLDLAIIFLDVNDLKKRFSLSGFDIAEGARVLAGDAGIKNGTPPVGKLTTFAGMFDGSEAKSQKLAGKYRHVGSALGCHLFDTSAVIVSSDPEGIHLEQSEHAKPGKTVTVKIKEITG